MKYNIGDMVLVKDINHRPRLRPRLLPRLHPRLLPSLRLRLKNTFGIITGIEKHSDIFEKDSKEADNGYIWFSQFDGQEYYFYEDEVDGEIV